MTAKPGWFLFDGMVRLDLEGGSVARYRFPEGTYGSESPMAPRVGSQGEDDGYVVTFVSVGIIGGGIIQYPLGYLSDLWDRRKVLLVTTIGSLVTGLALGLFAGGDPLVNFALVFIFGSFAMPMYSLSAAHANDRAGPGEFVLVNAALMLVYSFGPFAAATFMQWFGPTALFFFTTAIYAVFTVLIIYRMGARASVPSGARGKFTALLRTSTIFAKLARRPESHDKDEPG
jgi:MFS family permease